MGNLILELHLCLVATQGISGAIPGPSPLHTLPSPAARPFPWHTGSVSEAGQQGQPGRDVSGGFLVHANEMEPGRKWSQQGWASRSREQLIAPRQKGMLEETVAAT